MKEYIEREAIQRTVETDMDMQDLYLPSHFLFVIEDIPAAEVMEVRHGRWIDKSFKGIFYSARIVECEHCHNTLDLDGVNAGRGDANYCPNCGAKMDGGAE